MAANRFFIWEMHADDPRAFDPHDPDATHGDDDLRYYVGVCAALDREAPDAGLTVLVSWHLDRFEERFRDAVVLLINDESYQLPSYAGQVRALFKTGGIARNPLRDTLRLHPAVAWRWMLRDARNVARALGRRARTPQTRGAPVQDIPLGYLRLTDVEPIPFDERPVDVWFAGSIESERGFTVRPRLAARRQMAVALRAAQRELPDLRVDFSDGGPMANPDAMLSGDVYSERLARARIVLCPRGNFDETHRLTEAAKVGCVTICERLPARWYYEGAPLVELDRWSQLPAVLRRLLADPAALTARADAMREWYDASLSEEAIGRFVARELGCATVRAA